MPAEMESPNGKGAAVADRPQRGGAASATVSAPHPRKSGPEKRTVNPLELQAESAFRWNVQDARAVALVEEFFAVGRDLTSADFASLARHGIDVRSLALDEVGRGWGTRVADVVLDDLGRFEVARPGEPGLPALIVVARDECGEPADLVAIKRKSTSSRLGFLPLLGMENLDAPRIVGPLPLCAGPTAGWDWLKAGRAGCAVLHARRAFWLLEGRTILAADTAQASTIARQLVPPTGPKIVLPRMAEAA